MSNVYQVVDNCPDGANIGKTAADKIAFHGVAPVIQQATAASATDASTVIALANALKLALTNIGITN